ncbi:N-acetyl sugar amidotransferase [Herbaspirillum huttiense]|uniref:N-acetyl sugar amidotransferase n=1 Tax=Herbaspirillum huttiense TaxID=863372 RepID=UPI0039B01FC8
MNNTYQICTFCVMDSSNPAIKFDEKGQCNCCKDALARRSSEWWPNPEGAQRMDRLVAHLKRQGQGRPYDAMVGLSGGIDSAYLAHLASKKYGLRLLAVHVDGGWNSEPAVANIESMVRGLNIDFHTHVIEWQEMRDLQVAFLKASVLNQDMPQDHAFFATLYRTASRFKIRDFLSGVNFSSESIVPPGFGHPSIDGKHIRAIHDEFGHSELKSYPFMGVVEYLWLTRVRRQLTIHRPLNYFDYNKELAQAELRSEYGWRDYGGKHSESRFTKFYQDVYLPRKFRFDKRRLHLSSLIVAGQTSRSEALEELELPPITEIQARRDIKFVAKKLGMTEKDLAGLIEAPAKQHADYPNHLALFLAMRDMKTLLRKRSSERK